MPSYKWNKKKIKIPGSSFLSAYHRPWHTNVGVRLAAMVFGLFALTLYSTLVQANAVRVTFLDQTPPNIVPQGQNTITYTIQTENFNDGGTPSSIGVGIQVLVNGSVVSADSGEFTTSDCRVDPLYPTAFACNSLSEGGRQTINLTWNNPDPGTSTVSFRASCQLLPVQNPPVLCSTFGTSDSTITTVEAPLLQFQNSNFTVNENGGSATIFVTRSGVSTGAVTVGYSVYNGTATAGSDFQSVNGTLSWADGDTSAKSFDVPILDDILVEGSETVNLRLYSPGGGAALGNPSNAVLTINDVENGEIAFTAADYTVSEDGNTATIDIQRTGGSDGSVSVQFTSANGSATAGSDYTDSSTVVTWAAGESGTKSITIPIIDDTLVEGDETVNLSLSNPTGGARLGTNSAALLTIADVENGELQLSSSSYSVSENGGTITIDITRASGSDGAVTVQYATSDGTATAGSDYTSSSGTVSWAAGETGAKTFSVTIVNDVLVEGDETIIIALSNPTGGARLGTNNSATLTIVDVENGEIQFGAPSYSVREDGNLVSVEVIRSGGSDGAVSVQFTSANGSASAGSDYTDSSAPVNWADGESGTKIINIPILDDNIVEGDETINLTLTAPTNGARLGSQNASVVTITDVEHGVIQLDSLS
jgi:ribosomal protein L35AE/L33A